MLTQNKSILYPDSLKHKSLMFKKTGQEGAESGIRIHYKINTAKYAVQLRNPLPDW